VDPHPGARQGQFAPERWAVLCAVIVILLATAGQPCPAEKAELAAASVPASTDQSLRGDATVEMAEPPPAPDGAGMPAPIAPLREVDRSMGDAAPVATEATRSGKVSGAIATAPAAAAAAATAPIRQK